MTSWKRNSLDLKLSFFLSTLYLPPQNRRIGFTVYTIAFCSNENSRSSPYAWSIAWDKYSTSDATLLINNYKLDFSLVSTELPTNTPLHWKDPYSIGPILCKQPLEFCWAVQRPHMSRAHYKSRFLTLLVTLDYKGAHTRQMTNHFSHDHHSEQPQFSTIYDCRTTSVPSCGPTVVWILR